MNVQEQVQKLHADGAVPGDTIMAVFNNTLGNARYSFKSGKIAIFLNGKYMTNIKEEIEELMAEVQAGNPYIFVNPDELTVDTKKVDPMEAIKARIRKELLEEQARIAAGGADYGTSTEGRLNVATTRDIGAAASGSTSVDGGAATAAPTAKIIPGSKA